ncbi:hypothetical protein D3C81_1114630 [compost metagenome]
MLHHEAGEVIPTQAFARPRVRFPAAVGEEAFEQLNRLLLLLTQLGGGVFQLDGEPRPLAALLDATEALDLTLAGHDHRRQDRRLIDHGAHHIEAEVARRLVIVAQQLNAALVQIDGLHAGALLLDRHAGERDHVRLAKRLGEFLLFHLALHVFDDRQHVRHACRHRCLLGDAQRILALVGRRSRIVGSLDGIIGHAARMPSRRAKSLFLLRKFALDYAKPQQPLNKVKKRDKQLLRQHWIELSTRETAEGREKLCPYCGIWQPHNDECFYFIRTRGHYHSYCKTCMIELKLQRRHARRAAQVTVQPPRRPMIGHH